MKQLEIERLKALGNSIKEKQKELTTSIVTEKSNQNLKKLNKESDKLDDIIERLDKL